MFRPADAPSEPVLQGQEEGIEIGPVLTAPCAEPSAVAPQNVVLPSASAAAAVLATATPRLPIPTSSTVVYSYTPLINLKVGGKANVYAVVVDVGLPRKSRGDDWCLSVRELFFLPFVGILLVP